jgi:8-amino-7-oxononanoate synthase
MMTRSSRVEFPRQGMTWHYARMHRSVFPAFDPLDRLRKAATAREAAGLRRQLIPRSPGDRVLDLASNDYLGLSRDPRLAEAAAAAARTWGTGATGSRLVTGTTQLHAELEEELADFTGAPAALVFSSGYLANLAVVTALGTALGGAALGGGLLIVSDERNHASLIDACRLARGRGVRLQVTPHRDTAAVATALECREEAAALVVTDAVFSVTGELAPLAALHAIARRHGALLVIDEAHSFGVLGDGGRGAAHDAGIAAEPAVVRTITLSKSLAGQGGAVLAAGEVTQTLVDTGRGFIFDTALAPPATGAALATVRLLRADPRLPGQARRAASRLAGAAAELGMAATAPAAAVAAVILGDPLDALQAQRACAARGVQVGCFRPPSVPAGQACLRLTGRATLTENDINLASRALAVVREHCHHGRNTPQAGRTST